MAHYKIHDSYKSIDMVINTTTHVNHVVVKYFDDNRKSISLDLPFETCTNILTYSNNLLDYFT